MTLTTLPGPAISTSYGRISIAVQNFRARKPQRTRDVEDSIHTFSCQLSRTLMAWPPPSPPPLACPWEKPVACGVICLDDEAEDIEDWAIPLYLQQEDGG